MFDDHPLSAQILPVQLVDSVVGIAVVLEFHESISEGEKAEGNNMNTKCARVTTKFEGSGKLSRRVVIASLALARPASCAR